MIRGNASDFIDHPLPKHFVSAHGASHHPRAPGPPPSKPGVDWARELYKSYTDSGSLGILKKFKFCVWVVCWWRHNGGVFASFWPRLIGPGRQPNEPFFLAKVFLETRLWSEFLQLLIGFLAFLEPKLWLKNKNLGKKSSPTKAGM